MKKNVIKQSILLTVALTIAMQPAAIAAGSTTSAPKKSWFASLLTLVNCWGPTAPIKPPVVVAPPRPVAKTVTQQIYTGITDTAYKGFTMVKNHPWYTAVATSVLATIGLGWYINKMLIKYGSTKDDGDKNTKIPKKQKLNKENEEENENENFEPTPKDKENTNNTTLNSINQNNIVKNEQNKIEATIEEKKNEPNTNLNSTKVSSEKSEEPKSQELVNQPQIKQEKKESNEQSNINPMLDFTKNNDITNNEEKKQPVEPENINNQNVMLNFTEKSNIVNNEEQQKLNSVIEQKKLKNENNNLNQNTNPSSAEVNSKKPEEEPKSQKLVNQPQKNVVISQEFSNLDNEKIKQEKIKSKQQLHDSVQIAIDKLKKKNEPINSNLNVPNQKPLEVPVKNEQLDKINKRCEYLKNQILGKDQLIKQKEWDGLLTNLVGESVESVDQWYSALEKLNLLGQCFGLAKIHDKHWLYFKILQKCTKEKDQKNWLKLCVAGNFGKQDENFGLLLSNFIKNHPQLFTVISVETENKKEEQIIVAEPSNKANNPPCSINKSNNENINSNNIVNKKYEKPLPKVPQEKLQNILMVAIQNDNTARIPDLIKAGADLNKADTKGQSPISAAQSQNMVYCLLHHGAVLPVKLDDETMVELYRQFTANQQDFITKYLPNENACDENWSSTLSMLVWQDVKTVEAFYNVLIQQRPTVAKALALDADVHLLYFNLAERAADLNEIARKKYWQDQYEVSKEKSESLKTVIEYDQAVENIASNMNNQQFNELCKSTLKLQGHKIEKDINTLQTTKNESEKVLLKSTIEKKLNTLAITGATLDKVGKKITQNLNASILQQDLLKNSFIPEAPDLNLSMIKPVMKENKQPVNKVAAKLGTNLHKKLEMAIDTTAVVLKKTDNLKQIEEKKKNQQFVETDEVADKDRFVEYLADEDDIFTNNGDITSSVIQDSFITDLKFIREQDDLNKLATKDKLTEKPNTTEVKQPEKTEEKVIVEKVIVEKKPEQQEVVTKKLNAVQLLVAQHEHKITELNTPAQTTQVSNPEQIETEEDTQPGEQLITQSMLNKSEQHTYSGGFGGKNINIDPNASVNTALKNYLGFLRPAMEESAQESSVFGSSTTSSTHLSKKNSALATGNDLSESTIKKNKTLDEDLLKLVGNFNPNNNNNNKGNQLFTINK